MYFLSNRRARPLSSHSWTAFSLSPGYLPNIIYYYCLLLVFCFPPFELKPKDLFYLLFFRNFGEEAVDDCVMSSSLYLTVYSIYIFTL